MSTMEIDKVLAQIRALSAQTQINKSAAPVNQGGAPTEFAKLMSDGLASISQAQEKAGNLSAAFERGDPGVDLPQVMLEMQKASISFRAMTEVRNKLVDAYQQIMNMPI